MPAVITTQMFPFGSTAAADKTLKIRVLDKKPLLAGTVPRWVDFTNITDPASGKPLRASLQPAHHFAGSNTLFVLLTEPGTTTVVGVVNETSFTFTP